MVSLSSSFAKASSRVLLGILAIMLLDTVVCAAAASANGGGKASKATVDSWCDLVLRKGVCEQKTIAGEEEPQKRHECCAVLKPWCKVCHSKAAADYASVFTKVHSIVNAGGGPPPPPPSNAKRVKRACRPNGKGCPVVFGIPVGRKCCHVCFPLFNPFIGVCIGSG